MPGSTVAVDLPRRRAPALVEGRLATLRHDLDRASAARRCVALMNPDQPNAVTYYVCLWLMADGSIRVAGSNNYHEQAQGGSPYAQSLPGHVSLPPDLVGRPWTILAAYGQSAVLTEAGDVCMWGYNGHGQLGNGTTNNADVPALVEASRLGPRGGLAGRRVRKLVHTSCAASEANAWYALTEDGSVRGWGYNGYGQLAQGNTTSLVYPTTLKKADAAALADIADVFATGGAYGAVWVRQRSGALWAAGYNGQGQLGLGDTANRSSLTALAALPLADTDAVVKLVASGSPWATGTGTVVAVLTRKGRLFMVGHNAKGACGRGHVNAATTLAEVTGGISGEVADVWILFDDPSVYAVLRDGSLWAWGLNAAGQLGLSDTTDRSTPAPVSGLTQVRRIAGAGHNGYHGAIALTRAGAVYTAGYYAYGGGPMNNATTFRRWLDPVPDLRFVDVAAAGYTSEVGYLALTEDGRVFAAGRNAGGKLGVGHANYPSVPQEVWF